MIVLSVNFRRSCKAIACWMVFGCACTSPAPKPNPLTVAQETHRQNFGDFDLPRKIGMVENIGLQLPVVSPDGENMLYLRTDQEFLPPMTLLGANPFEKPETGILSIWIRPLRGADFGRRISDQRCCHSAVWSRSGQFIVYVANESQSSSIHLFDLAAGQDTALGVDGTINCLPRFGLDDQTVIFCSAQQPSGPFRIYRQTVGDQPIALSPEENDCVLPALMRDDGSVICARVEADHLNWIRCLDGHMVDLLREVGVADRPALLQTWAGINTPVSPDGRSLAFFDGLQNRIGVLYFDERIVRRHRPGTAAACFLDSHSLALATPEGLFAVDTETGVSISLMNGQWIPLAFIAEQNRLVLLGKEGSGARFAIFEMIFRPQPAEAKGKS